LERLIEIGQSLVAFLGQRDVNHSSIRLATLPRDEPRFFQAVDQAGYAGHNRNRAAGDLKAWQRSTFAPQDTQDVVLGWRQIVSPKEPSKADQLLIVRASDIQHGLLFQGLEGPLFL
jgi:hypothetical protein